MQGLRTTLRPVARCFVPPAAGCAGKPPRAAVLSPRGTGPFDTSTQQPPTSQVRAAHWRAVLARPLRPSRSPKPSRTSDGGRPCWELPSGTSTKPRCMPAVRYVHPASCHPTARSGQCTAPCAQPPAASRASRNPGMPTPCVPSVAPLATQRHTAASHSHPPPPADPSSSTCPAPHSAASRCPPPRVSPRRATIRTRRPSARPRPTPRSSSAQPTARPVAGPPRATLRGRACPGDSWNISPSAALRSRSAAVIPSDLHGHGGHAPWGCPSARPPPSQPSMVHPSRRSTTHSRESDSEPAPRFGYTRPSPAVA